MTYFIVSIATHLLSHVALIVVLGVICVRLVLVIAFRVWLLLRRVLSLRAITGSLILAVGLRVRLLLRIWWLRLRIFVLGILPLRALLLWMLLLRIWLPLSVGLVRRILRRGWRRIR